MVGVWKGVRGVLNFYLHSFIYVCRCYTCVILMHQHIYLHSLTHPIYKFNLVEKWYIINEVIFAPFFFFFELFPYVCNHYTTPPSKGCRHNFSWDHESNLSHGHLPFHATLVSLKFFNPNRSNIFIDSLNPKMFSFIS